MPSLYTIRKPTAGYTCYIELTTADVKRLTKNGNKRVLCQLNDSVELHAAIMKSKEGMHYIMIAAKYLRQLGLRVHSQVKAEIKIDNSELQFSIPEEFAEVMNTDPAAKKIFDQLSPGNKRGLIALVNMVKSSDKKIERSLLIAEKLKGGVKSPQGMMSKK
jgi:uncharacterized protein YdeI (YjbR/CyaY-like superfamily)